MEYLLRPKHKVVVRALQSQLHTIRGRKASERPDGQFARIGHCGCENLNGATRREPSGGMVLLEFCYVILEQESGSDPTRTDRHNTVDHRGQEQTRASAPQMCQILPWRFATCCRGVLPGQTPEFHCTSRRQSHLPGPQILSPVPLKASYRFNRVHKVASIFVGGRVTQVEAFVAHVFVLAANLASAAPLSSLGLWRPRAGTLHTFGDS